MFTQMHCRLIEKIGFIVASRRNHKRASCSISSWKSKCGWSSCWQEKFNFFHFNYNNQLITNTYAPLLVACSEWKFASLTAHMNNWILNWSICEINSLHVSERLQNAHSSKLFYHLTRHTTCSHLGDFSPKIEFIFAALLSTFISWHEWNPHAIHHFCSHYAKSANLSFISPFYRLSPDLRNH